MSVSRSSSRSRIPSAERDHPIHIAAERGDLRRVRALAEADPTLLHRGDRAGGTALHRAVIGRAPRLVELLLDLGSDIHAIHGDGLGSAAGYAPVDLQPIDLAIWGGPCQVPSLRVFVAGVRGALRERFATSRRVHDLDSARLLIARGADHDLATAAALGDIDRVTALLEDNPARINEARPNSRRPLSAAVEFGHERIVRLLLERGADPTWPDADDSPRGSALHAAARAGNRPLVELLLANGADPSANVDSAGNATFAARTPELRALLVKHGGTVDPYDLVWLGDDEGVMRAVTRRSRIGTRRLRRCLHSSGHARKPNAVDAPARRRRQSATGRGRMPIVSARKARHASSAACARRTESGLPNARRHHAASRAVQPRCSRPDDEAPNRMRRDSPRCGRDDFREGRRVPFDAARMGGAQQSAAIWSTSCSRAAHPPTFPTMNRGRRRWHGPSVAGTERSPRFCGGTERDSYL